LAKALIGLLLIFIVHLPRLLYLALLVSYAAIELRFALERMAQRDLMFTEMASSRMLKDHDPSKRLANLHRIAPNAVFAHEIYMVDKKRGHRFKWGEYKPIDRLRVAEIQGRLGDLLHAKEGLHLGIRSDSWYANTKQFLHEAADYLQAVYEDNSGFFSVEGIDGFEIVRAG
jgi:hypothetical protein